MKLVDIDPPTTLLRDLYARLLQTRLVDEYAWRLHQQGYIDFIARAYGHEAAQVGSAVCIEKGTDFTLPYYRDLGVVLTIGMTPYEIFRTYLQSGLAKTAEPDTNLATAAGLYALQHWGYHKHNIVTGPAPVATQILHAAGIAFASKLRKASAVTVAYCGDGATTEPDFHEGIRFAALHQLPAVFICEQDCTQNGDGELAIHSRLEDTTLPNGLAHHCLDGADVVAVYTAMYTAMQHAREGHGPVLLEMCVTRPSPHLNDQPANTPDKDAGRSMPDATKSKDPLLRCQQILEQQNDWDQAWATRLYQRLEAEIEQAMKDALRNPNC